MSSPIDSWEGAEAIFTFADKPAVIGFILILSIVATVGVIVASYVHEKKTYIDYQ